MNIRVNLNTDIADGSEVVFRSPADCSQVTGLVIYHNGGKTEFAFADAHGHNVGDIDHLFAENAVVKVILDVTAGMAFVQNADTNAYIESTFVKTINGQSPDENGNVEIEISEGASVLYYDGDIRELEFELSETGCYLLSATGVESNKTAFVADSGYAKITVAAGGKYQITTYIPKNSGIIFYDKNGSMVSADEGGVSGGNVRVTDYEIIVPKNATTMGVSTRNINTDPIRVKSVEKKTVTPQAILEGLSQQKTIHSECEANGNDRMYAMESRLGFSFKGLDKGKVIFMTDGTRSILSDVYDKFQTHEMPLSVAPVWNTVVNNSSLMNDGSTELEFLHLVEDDGGEIFAHSMNGDAITADTAEEMLRESKRWLMDEGFDVRGWIAPRGIFCPEARELYAKYYRYGYRASDKQDSPLNFNRPYLSELGLEGAMGAIDACEAEKSVIVLFHHWSDNEIEGFNLDDLEALLSYIETKNVDVTTYRDCFFKYGSYGATEETGIGGGGIQVSGAVPGQFLKVAEVDEKGVPIAWTTAEMPTGGAWRKIIDFDIEEDCASVEFENDSNGNPIKASRLFAMITLAVPADEAWTSIRKFCVSPYLAKDVPASGVAAMWHSGSLEVAPVTKYGGTASTHTAVLMEIMGANMAIGQAWNSYNNSSITNNLILNTNYFTAKTENLRYLKQPYATGFNMTSYQIAFPAGSRLQVWAIDYAGEV